MKKIIFIFFFLSLFCSQGQNIYTLAGNGTMTYSGDGGPANLSEIWAYGVATDAAGNIYILDSGNHRVRKINTSGVISTIAGIGIAGYSGDGGLATLAQIYSPNGLSVDAIGNVYFTDFVNSCIRMINTSGIISTITGTAGNGFSGDGGPAALAKINQPVGIAIDGTNNIYFADYGNARIRKISSTGAITTIAGTGTFGYSGDGTAATSAQINEPEGIAVDASGNIYFADFLNFRIRKINSFGIISTIAGNGVSGYSGDGGPATSAKIGANSIALDALGNLYFSDIGNQRIRKINLSGIVNTVAGNGVSGYSGDGGLATSAQLNQPIGIALDASSNFYISDYNNFRIRVVCASNCLAGIDEKEINTHFSLYPNPTNDLVNLNLNQQFIGGNIQLFDAIGKILQTQAIKNTTEKINLNLNSGIYFIKATTKDGVSKTEKLIVE